MNFRKFRRSKALSPVIATIILIAVTVAVSVVVAAWMGALTIGFMGNSEQAKITNVVLSNVATTPIIGQAVVTIQNTRIRHSDHFVSHNRWKYRNCN